MAEMQDMTLSQLKKRKTLYGFGSFGVTVAPTAAVIVSRWELYTKGGGGIRLGLGGLLLGFFLLFVFLGKVKIPGRVVMTGFVFVLCYLFSAVISDVLLLSGVAFGSVTADALWTGRVSKKLAREIELKEAAERAGKATLEGVKEYLRQGGSGA